MMAFAFDMTWHGMEDGDGLILMIDMAMGGINSGTDIDIHELGLAWLTGPVVI